MTTPNNNTPDDIRGIESALDQLASAESSSAPAGLGDRIYLRTAASLQDGAADTSSGPAPAPIPFYRNTAFRIAAVIAFAVAASAFFFIPASTTAPSEQTAALTEDEIIEEIDTILLAAYESQPIEALDELDAQLAELFASDELSEFERWLETEEAL